MRDEITEIVAYSGGKDSTAMALWLEDTRPSDRRLFLYTPTGNELPEMKLHMEQMSRLFKKNRFVKLRTPSLVELIHEMRCIPNHRMRFCTRILKIEPCIEYLRTVSNPLLFVGLRADEPMRRGLYDEDVAIAYPLRENGFTISDVYAYLEKKDIAIPERTDCAWCFYQRLIEWWRLWKDHLSLYLEAESLEAQYGHTFRTPSKDKHPVSLQELRARFECGWLPKFRKNKTGDFRGGCRVCTM